MLQQVVIVKQGCKKYLFSAPIDIDFKAGDHVLCDTSRGETEGVCVYDGVHLSTDNALKIFCDFLGATVPLKKIIGKYEIKKF